MPNELKSYLDEAQRLREDFVRDEKEILQGIADGDDRLRKKLIEGNLLLVVKIAYEFINRGLSLAELISEGNKILQYSAKKFDVKKGAKFSSYVAVGVRRCFQNVLRTRGTLIKTSNTTGIHGAMKVRYWADNYFEQNGSEPDIKTIQKSFPDFSKAQIRSYLQSIIWQLEGGDEWDPVESLAVEFSETSYHFERKELELYLVDLMEKVLDQRTIDIVKKRTGMDNKKVMTLEEVAREYNITRQRIRQIYIVGLQKLRNAIDPSMIFHLQHKTNEEYQNGSFIRHRIA